MARQRTGHPRTLCRRDACAPLSNGERIFIGVTIGVMHALRVLEFDQIRQRLQKHCETTMAAASAEEIMPSFESDEVWQLLEETRQAMDLLAKHQVPSLGRMRDRRQALTLASKGGVLGGQELFEIADLLGAIREMKEALTPRQHDYPLLWEHVRYLQEQKRLEDQLFHSLDPDGSVKDAASPELGTLRARKRGMASRIQERIQSYTTGSTRDLLSDPIYTMRDGRYVVPVKSEYRGRIRGIVHDTSATGATVFVEPEEVLQLGNQLRQIEAAERAEIVRVLTSLSGKVGAVAVETKIAIEQLGKLDFVLARAKYGYQLKGSIPERLPFTGIEIQGGRHPLLEREKVVPLDLDVHEKSSVLITGPNTGGKTVAIKTVGLFVLMAQCGIPLPALQIKLGVFSQVWADIGDEQSLEQSLSTFSGHIKNIADALKQMKPGAIVLLDEVGAGTDPAEGAALARAVLVDMQRKGATILASTHYGELKAFAFSAEGFTNAAMEFDTKSLRPTYRLILGAPGASQALRIAERYGIPEDVVGSAREGLGQQALDLAAMLEKLEQAQKQARIAQGEADRRLNELRKQEAEADRRLREAKDIRENVHGKAQEAIEDALREIRLEAAAIFDELKRAPDQRSREEVRKKLKDLQEVGSDFSRELAPKRASKSADHLVKGAIVKVEGYSQTGTVISEPRDGSIQIQIGILKMTLPISKVEVVSKQSAPAQRKKPNVRLEKAQTATTEIHLRAMRAEDAERELERFVDDAVLGGVDSVRIVHGKGEGILRKLTQDYLRRHPHVSRFRLADASEGGDGVTVAELK